jgi:type IV pilus assembly protein PilQ
MMRINRKIKIIPAFIVFILSSSFLFGEEAKKAPAAQESARPTMDLDVKDVDIRDIAGMFSRVSGLNVVVSDDVKASVTLRATNVDWETALNMILKTYNLTALQEGNFLRIVTYAKIQQEEQGAPLVNKVVFLNFINAEDVAQALESIKSPRGRISADKTTKSLVIKDTEDTINKMLLVIEELDRRTPQVMIDALMVDVKLTDEDELGIAWSIVHKEVSGRSFTQSLAAGSSEGIIRYGKTIFPHANLAALIDFWTVNRRAEILANPKVLTLDGHEASIELTDQIPYTQTSIATTAGDTISSTLSFKESGIKLFVTPYISVGGFVSLHIKTEQSFQSGTVTTSGTTLGAEPIIDSRKAETDLLVSDGETIVIGGLRKKENTRTIDKLPILGDLPLVGKLFRRNVGKEINTELLIFVTPYIVTEPYMTKWETKNFKRFDAIKEDRPKAKYEETPFPLRAPK